MQKSSCMIPHTNTVSVMTVYFVLNCRSHFMFAYVASKRMYYIIIVYAHQKTTLCVYTLPTLVFQYIAFTCSTFTLCKLPLKMRDRVQ